MECREHLRTNSGDRRQFDTWSFQEDRAGLMRELVHAPVNKNVLIEDATHFVIFENKRFVFFDEVLKFLKEDSAQHQQN